MGGSPPAFFCAPILFFLFSEKEKNRRSVRRSLLHSASTGAAKAPYSQPPSSFPKADRCAGSPFGSNKKRKETTRGTFRMVPRPLHRPEPCSGLAAYGSRKTYDRICRGRCRAQLFATKERYRCGLPLAGTHRPLQAQPKCGAGSEEAKRLPLDRGRRLI